MSGFLPTDYSGGMTNHGTPNPTQFIFPVLKNAEILTCCSELEIELSKAELTEPHRHKEHIRKVFWQLLDICFGITEEDLAKRIPSVQDESVQTLSPFPDLHDASPLLDVLFFRELSRCMRVVGVYDFSWKDLHNPTAKRFRCQMSAIINMAKFREEQLRKYYELMEPRNELVGALQEVHSEHELLMEQLHKTQEQSSVKMDEINAVMRECQQLESDIAKANKQQAGKREEAAALKREVNDLKDQLASATWALQEAQAEEEKLRAKIVSSPDRRSNELQQLKDRLSTEKEQVNGMQDAIEAAKTKRNWLVQLSKKLTEVLDAQEHVMDEGKKLQAVQDQLTQTEKEIADNEEKVGEINQKTEEAQRALMRAEEKLQQSRKQAKIKMDAAQDRLEIAKEQLLLVEKERREGMARVEAGEAEVRELKARMEEDKKQTEREIADLIAEYKETENAFLKQNELRMKFVEAVL
eukprot:Nitzschia sp. Nitz4//scaffold125_size66327//42069//43472//NITZ4_006134-RA/size66327-processed-gene-0.31-mRNA-1//-1//CDS//3329534622//3104//frame0